MADTLDTYIKSPAPPKDPDAQYVYNEQQFSKLEGALRKHHDKILAVQDNSTALYEHEVTVRATKDEAIVQTLEALTATVAQNETTTQGQVVNLQQSLADANSATALKLSTLEAKVDTGDSVNRALINDEAKTRATKVDAIASKVSALEASVKTGQSESRALVKQETQARADAVSAEATKRENLSAYVGYTDGQSYSKTLSASLTDEQSARVAADAAVAQRVMTTAAGTSRVYSQNTAPTSSGRQEGDIWIDTTVPSGASGPNLTPYVWHSGLWNNNTDGSYSQYAGNNATLNQISTVVNDTTNGLAYQWQLAGTTGTSGGASSITLTGATKKNADGSTTSATKIVLKATNITMDGDVIVTGSVTAAQIATGDTNGIQTANLASNSVTSIAAGTQPSATPVVVGCNITPVAGSTLLCIGSVDQSVSVSSATTLVLSVVLNGATVSYNTAPISSFAGTRPVPLGNFYVSAANWTFSAYGPLTMWGFASDGALIPRSMQVQYTLPSSIPAGSTLAVYCAVIDSASNYLSTNKSIAVWQFKK